MAHSKLEYLIERNIINSPMIINKELLYGDYTYADYLAHPELFTENNIFTYKIQLNDSVKYIYWNIKFFTSETTAIAKYYEKQNWNEYGCHLFITMFGEINIDPCLDKIQIKINGRDREVLNDELFYTYAHPISKGLNSLERGNYCFCYALFPQLLQPSGTCNYSQLEDASISMTLKQDIIYHFFRDKVFAVVKLYAKAYNILRVISGKAGLAFV